MVRLVRDEYATDQDVASRNRLPADCHFDPTRPWDHLFSTVIDEERYGKWWTRELERPRLPLVCSSASMGSMLGGDALMGQTAARQTPPGVNRHHSTIVPDTVGT